MYGKFFASTFTGSMFGAGTDVFALWGYIVANVVDSSVELNPPLLAAVLGATPDRIEQAIAHLLAPDPKSRNPAMEGRRLIHENGFQYRVTSHELYRNIRNEEDRRAYNRMAQAKSRAKRKAIQSNGQSLTRQTKSAQSNGQDGMSAASAHTEADTDTEANTEILDSKIRVTSNNKPVRAPDRAREPIPTDYRKTPILGRNPHLSHVFCDPELSYCVPDAVHRKLAERLAPKHAGDREAAFAELLAWYPLVVAKLVSGFIMGDAFKFWQSRFDETYATPDAPKNRAMGESAEQMAEGVRKRLVAEGIFK